jgi:hypothetical protein
MPLLALGENGNGRTLALTVDDTHKLAFSEAASRTAGRGYGLLWDALLGWLMRDPRYEPARIDLESICRSGAPLHLKVRAVPGVRGEVELMVAPMAKSGVPVRVPVAPVTADGPFDVVVPPLETGAYTARLRIGTGPSTRRDFACERGGEEWADSRPDAARLSAIADSTGGKSVSWKDAGKLPMPAPTQVTSERHVKPVLPAWAWTLAAALALGLHWIVRRRRGLA